MGCASNNTNNSSTVNNHLIETDTTVENQMEFYDSEIFDLKLGTTLLANPSTFQVDVLAPFSVNQIPKRVDMWLSAVNSRGGSVHAEPDPNFVKEKAFLELVDLIIQVYKEVKELVIYGAAGNYNVTVFYKPSDGKVTKMVFEHK